MIDRNNEVEHTGLKIKFNHIKDVQNLMKQYSSLRFLYNPRFWKHGPYFEIGYGGDGPDVSAFDKELYESGWLWEREEEDRTPWWQKLFGRKK